MIRLDNVSKQVGHQILFIEASAALQRGEKIGPRSGSVKSDVDRDRDGTG